MGQEESYHTVRQDQASTVTLHLVLQRLTRHGVTVSGNYYTESGIGLGFGTRRESLLHKYNLRRQGLGTRNQLRCC
jgi:hypothetical protein